MSPSDSDPLYRAADFYDQLYRDRSADRDYYLGEASGSVLELACGTGRLAIPLAEAGLTVVGLDLSTSMLARAAGKSQAVEWVHGDFRDFSLHRRFDTILIGFNSMQHCLAHADVRALFGCVQGHLAPGGRFLFDVFQPNIGFLASEPGSRRPLNGSFGAPVEVELIGYDACSQVLSSAFLVADHRLELHLRCFFPQELATLVESGGWEVVARYGDFDLSPLSSDSPKQIYVCRRAGESNAAEERASG